VTEEEGGRKNLKRALVISVAILLVLLAAGAVFVHRLDIYCLYLYARARTWDRDDLEFKLKVVGELKEARSIRLLCWMLEDEDAEVRRSAASKLVWFFDKRAVEPLIEALEDTDKRVCAYAAYALGHIKDRRAIPPMLKLLDKLVAGTWPEDPIDDWKKSITGFTRPVYLEFPAETTAEDMLETLTTFFVPEDFLPCYVIWNFYEMPDSRALEGLGKILKQDKNEHSRFFRFFAAAALGKLGNRRALEPLREALKTETDKNTRRAIEEAIGKLEKTEGK